MKTKWIAWVLMLALLLGMATAVSAEERPLGSRIENVTGKLVVKTISAKKKLYQASFRPDAPIGVAGLGSVDVLALDWTVTSAKNNGKRAVVSGVLADAGEAQGAARCLLTGAEVRVFAAAKSVTLTNTKLTMKLGEGKTLGFRVNPEATAEQYVTFGSSKRSVVEVDKYTGAMTARGKGKATVYATARGGKRRSCLVTVVVPVTGVSVAPAPLTLAKGKTKVLKATVAPANASDKSVRWGSSDSAVATVNSKGVVTGKAAGTATITAVSKENGEISGCCLVTVTAPSQGGVKVTAVGLEIAQHTVWAGDFTWVTIQEGSLKPANADIGTLYLESGNKAVAKVELVRPGEWKVTGLKAGVARLDYGTLDGRLKSSDPSFSITVKDPVRVTGVSFIESALPLSPGDELVLYAIVAPQNANNTGVSFASSNEDAVEIVPGEGDRNCTLRGRNPGTSVITATTDDGGFTAVCTVTVL